MRERLQHLETEFTPLSLYCHERFISDLYQSAINRFLDHPHVGILRNLQIRHFERILKLVATEFRGQVSVLKNISPPSSLLLEAGEIEGDFDLSEFLLYVSKIEKLLLNKYRFLANNADLDHSFSSPIASQLVPFQSANIAILDRLLATTRHLENDLDTN